MEGPKMLDKLKGTSVTPEVDPLKMTGRLKTYVLIA